MLTINEHLKHIFASEELNELSVIRNFRITASDGKTTVLKGKISFDEAKLYAETEFKKYRVIQDRKFESDFDRLLKSQKGALEPNE